MTEPTRLTNDQRERFRQWVDRLPGRRGRDIPEHVYDVIAPVAHGVIRGLTGRPAHPEQIQWLYDNGHHTPSQVHDAFMAMPHPNAPGMTVGEYQTYAHAYALHKVHRRA